MANAVDTHKGYRLSTGIITIILSALILIAGLEVSTLLVIGLLGVVAGVLELMANKKKLYYLISGIMLFVAAFLNIVIIKDVSLFAIYAVVIGIFNVKYSK